MPTNSRQHAGVPDKASRRRTPSQPQASGWKPADTAVQFRPALGKAWVRVSEGQTSSAPGTEKSDRCSHEMRVKPPRTSCERELRPLLVWVQLWECLSWVMSDSASGMKQPSLFCASSVSSLEAQSVECPSQGWDGKVNGGSETFSVERGRGPNAAPALPELSPSPAWAMFRDL